MFCLSKGLCAPAGSMLAGPADFIAKARRKRKIMGGGMRQVGILAAAGIIALNDMTGRLGEDHENARYLASRLASLPGLNVQRDALDINMVFFTLPDGVDGEAMAKYFREAGVKINPPENGACRFVVHYWIKRAHLDKVVSLTQAFLQGRA
jgi:threonine aldolase